MKIIVQNIQTKAQLDLHAVNALATGLSEFLVEADSNTSWGEITLQLMDDGSITQYNLNFLGKNCSTDVITFRYDPIPGEAPFVTGDLLINVECALREGNKHKGINEELALYIAHGFDHLSGADDHTQKERAAMRRTETQWLTALQSKTKKLILS